MHKTHLRMVSPSQASITPVFADHESRRLQQHLRRIAASDVGILVQGETGTGKELVARFLHHHSRRRNAPFIAVNCASLVDSLAESELFGHEKGAFTGAGSARIGWFEAANGGTLFLDEVGDMPLSIQVKMLRVLQEREVVRLGSRVPVPVNVRVIAATNVDLAEAVSAGRFREDLFYRLHVANVVLPPLRERPGDILPLARHFAEQYQFRLNLDPAQFTTRADARLLSHAWPGNARELENAIHYALLICENGVIDADDIKLVDRQTPSIVRKKSAAPSVDPGLQEIFVSLFETSTPDIMQKVEDSLVLAAYQHCHRNQSKTARLLGITRNILRMRLTRLGVIGEGRESETGSA